jgi:PAS domain S-box-containing protein
MSDPLRPSPARQLRPEDGLAGGGEMGSMMRAVDWSATSLGPVGRWPQSLRTALSMMLESRFAMVVAWGPEFRFFYNDRYRPILGAKHPHALGTPGAEIFPEIWDLIGPEFARTRRGETFALDDWYLPLARSGYRENCWFTVSYSPIRDETGGVGGMLAVVAETTERVEGERRLATLRELAAYAAETRTPEQVCESAARAFARNPIDVPFAIVYALDDDGQTARRLALTGLAADHPAAPAAVSLAATTHGWPLAQMAGASAAVVIDDLPTRFGALPGGPVSEPTHAAIALPLVRPGLAHPYGVLIAGISPRRALDDRYRGFFELAAEHIASAISSARLLEDQRLRAEALAELDRAKTAFFSNVSHELRTPLTLMLGPLEDLLAQRHGPVPPELQPQHELIHRNALRLHKLVDAMLDFSRIEAGRTRATHEPTDLAALTIELAAMFRAATERAGLALVVDCPPLPEPVFIDREMWESIVLNLLSNAFKFTFEGEIAVALRHAGDFVELSVRDTGCGIAPAELTRVFERFHRVEGVRSRTHEGAGIGLALALELARLHGGTIDVASELGAGTTFTVRIRTGRAHLPAERVATPARTPAPQLARAYIDEALRWLPDAPGDPEPLASSARVLVADDNADMRDYLRRVLAAHWQVTTVADGAAALAEAHRAPPDLVVSDVMMPGLDGFQLLGALRADERTRDVPVIMVSARAGNEARIHGLEAGVDDYLIKPFSARELVARVATQLAASAARRTAEVQRRAAESAAASLQETVSLLDATLENVPVGLAYYDRELRLVRMNQTLARVNGLDPVLALGRPLIEIMSPGSFEQLAPRIREVFATGQIETMAFDAPTLSAPDEGRSWLLMFYPVRTPSGEITQVGAVSVDVTDEVRARRQLARTVEYNEKFIAILGHDLRNPLNAITTSAELLQRRAATPEIARPATRIVLSAERMSRMIAQLLDLARVRVGDGLRVQPAPLDLGALCQLVLDELRQVHPAAALDLTTAGSLQGRWDGDRLAQVISNLAGNALEHGEGAAVRVDLDGRDPDSVVIRVENGGEIPDDVLATLFEPFRGVHHRRENTRGLGLGLYISRAIVVAHRGRIDVQSSREDGTRFHIVLPRMTENAP